MGGNSGGKSLASRRALRPNLRPDLGPNPGLAPFPPDQSPAVSAFADIRGVLRSVPPDPPAQRRMPIEKAQGDQIDNPAQVHARIMTLKNEASKIKFHFDPFLILSYRINVVYDR